MQTKDIAKQLRADAANLDEQAKRLRRAAQELDPIKRRRRKVVTEGRKQTTNR